MTIHDAKQKALKEWGYKTMQEAFEHGVLYENVISTAMHFYAQSKWDEACDRQFTNCLRAVPDEAPQKYYDAVKGAPIPEFKL